jgi:hypothetical protein
VVAAVNWRTSVLLAVLVVVAFTAVVRWRAVFFHDVAEVGPAAAGWLERQAWLASPGALHEAHARLSRQCGACHVPFGRPPDAKCLGCHAGATALLVRRVTAFHAAAVNCVACHTDHRGRVASISRMDHARLRDDVPCVSCHIDRHAGRFGETCATCHGVEGWNVPGYRHPSADNTLCRECHAAPPSHLMMHFEMVDRALTRQGDARVDQCWRCHLPDAWNDIRGVGWYKHH